jgi:SMI1 / KNR4 family (SUKH-1)
MTEVPDPSQTLSLRLLNIRTQLEIYESEQRSLLGNRENSPIFEFLPDENINRADRARRMLQRGGLMNPLAQAKEVEAFEILHGIQLPEDYKQFVIEVGNGGEGPPYYGLLPLGATPQYDVPNVLTQGYSGLLSKPFPFTEFWCWEEEESEELIEHRLHTIHYGNLILGNDGCGQYWSLVIVGEQKGKIWQLTDVGIYPCAPSLTFLDWYEYWLEGGDDWWREYVSDEAVYL